MGNDLPEGVVNAEPAGGWESGQAADPGTDGAEATDGSSESAVEDGVRYTPDDAQTEEDAAASGAGVDARRSTVTSPDTELARTSTKLPLSSPTEST